MKMRKIVSAWFSPMYHTREMAVALGKFLQKCFDGCALEERDLTCKAGNAENFASHDLLILAAPVYAGRIPNLFAKRLEEWHGDAGPAVLLASYGNRAYDNALAELRNMATFAGFAPVAAAACIARHTIADVYAQGRPDKNDLRELSDFAVKIAELIKNDKSGPLAVPGEIPDKKAAAMVLPQSLNENCVMCGICWQNCPSGAIEPDNPGHVDKDKCICCMRCVNVCPQKARMADPAFINGIIKKLEPLCSAPRQNEFFYI